MAASVPPTAIAASLTVAQLRHIVRKEIDAALATGAPVDEILTTDQVARRFGLHPKTVARLVRTEALPAHRLGGEGRGEYRFRASEVDAWFEARKAG
jgi:excisionase family DNA binding protein